MNTYDVKLGSIYWEIKTQNYSTLKKEVAERIEKFQPLNSSEEGAEAYRNRFRNQPFLAKLSAEKDYQTVTP